jgi:hypothetical protein
MDPKGKGMVVNDKEESFVNDPKDDKPTDSGSGHKRKDGRKKKTRRIKEIVYYDSDESSSSQKDDNNDYEKKKTVNSNFSFDYSRIPQSSNAHLISIPLGKPPHFDGKDYRFWSHKMRSHLFSLHPSIWEIVENGMHFDSTDSPMFINEQIHKNAQATTVLLASLLSAFRDRGVPKPTSECRCVPQPRWVERVGEREGGKRRWPETGVREVEIPRPSCSSRAQVGCACSRGLQASTWEREASGPKRAPVPSSSPRGQPSLRGPWSFLL